MVNKTCLILEHLKTYGSINPIVAQESYGVMRLADCIYRLKKKGYNIRTEIVPVKDRFGNDTTYAKYVMEAD